MTRLVICIFMIIFTASSALADVIAECGPSTGTAYFLKGGVVDQAHAGWHEDGIANGKFNLTISDGNLDIVFLDTTKGPRTASSEGGRVSLVKKMQLPDGSLNFLIMEAYLETGVLVSYVFNMNPDHTGESVYSTARAATAINKVSVMKAACSFPNR